MYRNVPVIPLKSLHVFAYNLLADMMDILYSKEDMIAEVDEYMASEANYLALVFENEESSMGKEVSFAICCVTMMGAFFQYCSL